MNEDKEIDSDNLVGRNFIRKDLNREFNILLILSKFTFFVKL